MKKNEIKPRENCIVCEELIYRGKNRFSYKLRRGKQCLTCGSKCSKIYTRIVKYIRIRITNKILEKYNIIPEKKK